MLEAEGIQDALPLVLPRPEPITPTDRRGSIDESFMRFHAANPHVYRALRQVALHAAARGKRVGMKAVYERVRWEYSVETAGDPYQLNNNYTSRYARLLMENEPQLAGFFETRRLHI